MLRFLALRDDYAGFGYFSFAPIAKGTKLKRSAVRLACRSLTRKGLLVFARGLWTEDGELYGSGYAITREGAAISLTLKGGK